MSVYTSNTTSNKRRPYQKPYAKLIFTEDNTSIAKYENIIREVHSYKAEKKLAENSVPLNGMQGGIFG